MSLFIAFAAGVVSFFAPCVLPLLPAYISYITGVTVENLTDNKTKLRKKILLASISYALGFCIIFVLLGVAAASFGVLLRFYAREIQIVGGLLMIFFGLEFAGIFNFSFLAQERKLKLPKWSEHFNYLKPFLLGIIFAAAWTPCIGPVLGSILTLAAVGGSVLEGAMLLFVYSLGITLPFFAVSLTLSYSSGYLKFIKNKIMIISRISGAVLIVIGVILVVGWYPYINAWVLNLFR